METYEKKEKRQFNKYDMAIGLFYGVGIFLGIGIFFVGGFLDNSNYLIKHYPVLINRCKSNVISS